MAEETQNNDHSKNDDHRSDITMKNSINKLKEKFVPGCKYSLLVAAICNFAMLVIGCLNVHKCPVNEKIPLYLIATGAIGLVSKFVSYFRRRISAHVQVVFFETSLYSVEAAFFFLGTFWVYKEYKPSFDPDEKDYCNETAYMFAFVHLTIYYCFIVFVAFVCCCIVCVAICVSATADSNEEQDIESQPAKLEQMDKTKNTEILSKSENETKT